MARKIIHCDADCFFAAVEMRDNPHLRSVPMAITGSLSKRGVISTCNYVARRYGIRSAMPTWQAKSLCPDLILVPHRMEKYRETSAAMMGIFTSFTENLEKVSVDEAYLDVTDINLHNGSATLLAKELRSRVAKELGITVSAGVAPNKFLAKVASEWRKPDGLYVIPPDKVDLFMIDLPVEYIQGVGNKAAQKLHNKGIYTCGDLQQQSLRSLVKQFGRFGPRLYECCRGVDNRPVSTERIRKSLSVEHTFGEDICSEDECRSETLSLFSKLSKRLENVPAHYAIRKIQVKVKFNNFKQTTLEQPGCVPSVEAYLGLISEGLAREKLPVRLLGIGVQFSTPEHFVTAGEQLSLFETC